MRRSARARRISLRISGVDGRVSMSAPPWVSEDALVGFAAEKEGWLRRRLSETPEVIPIRVGGRVPFRGRELVVVEGRRAAVSGNQITIPVRPAPAAALRGVLKVQARDALVQDVARFASRIGKRPGRMTLRDTRSRWGSCSSEGNLMFSWRLIMAPDEVRAYVAAHEVAHLLEMNHSPRFWREVAQLCPDYELYRRWLHVHGAELMRYQFD